MVNKSSQINELAEAMSLAQSVLPAPKKTKKVSQSGITKAGKSYKKEYFYADLSQVVEIIKAILPKYSLSFSQFPSKTEANESVLITLIMHKSGQWIESALDIPHGLSPQDMGSWLTYMKRYSLCSILGIAADDDDDGDGAQNGLEDNNQPPPNKSTESESKLNLATFNPSTMVPFGADKGKPISAIPIEELEKMVNWVQTKKIDKGEQITGSWQEFMKNASPYIERHKEIKK